MIVVNLRIVVNLVILKKSADSDEQARDLRHYSLFSLMSVKLTLFTLFLIFETMFIIFSKIKTFLKLIRLYLFKLI